MLRSVKYGTVSDDLLREVLRAQGYPQRAPTAVQLEPGASRGETRGRARASTQIPRTCARDREGAEATVLRYTVCENANYETRFIL